MKRFGAAKSGCFNSVRDCNEASNVKSWYVHFTGVSIGAPLSLMKNARNLAGLVLLALRPTI
jgi:hypothetical protein